MKQFKRLVSLFRKIWYLLSYRFRKPQIVVTRAKLSGDGSFIDVRYWLSRPDKAQGRFPVYVTDEVTGARCLLMRMAKFGLVRTRHTKYTTTGVLLFYNRNKLLKPGSKISMVFGPLRAEGICIE